MVKPVLVASVICVLLCSASLHADQRFVGVNYTHWQIGANCDVANHGILATYGKPGVRTTVKSQLATMNSQGVTSLRFLIWYALTPPEAWGQVQVRSDGTLPKPIENNLKQFLGDVKAAGFTRLSISLAPKGTLGPQFTNYDPVLLPLDWALVVQVRGVLKASGILSTAIDLLNEGAPNLYTRNGPDYDTDITGYIQGMYQRYYDAYGNADVTVSAVSEDPQAFPALLTILQGAGRPMPAWFEVHAYMWWYTNLDQGITDALKQDDAALNAAGLLTQPISLGETYYGTSAVSTGVLNYLAGTTRPVIDVTMWPLAVSSTCQPMSVTPPYSVSSLAPLR